MIVGHRDRAAETTVTGLIAQDVRAHNMICTCWFELQSCCKQWYISSLLYQNMLLQLCDLLRCGMQHHVWVNPAHTCIEDVGDLHARRQLESLQGPRL